MMSLSWGGGIGGLGCAALLAKEGMKVLVLEKSSFLGGRATSFKYKDYLLDVGMHVMSLGDVSPTEEILRKVGVKVHFVYFLSGFLRDMCLHAEYLSNFDSTYAPKGKQLFLRGYFGEIEKLNLNPG